MKKTKNKQKNNKDKSKEMYNVYVILSIIEMFIVFYVLSNYRENIIFSFSIFFSIIIFNLQFFMRKYGVVVLGPLRTMTLGTLKIKGRDWLVNLVSLTFLLIIFFLWFFF